MNEQPIGGTFPDAQNELTFDFGFLSLEYGDLPDVFATTLNEDGARHAFANDLYLGTCMDVEIDGNPDPMSGESISSGGDNNSGGTRTFGVCDEPGNDETGKNLNVGS